MLSAQEYRRIVSGQRRDGLAVCLRPLLSLASIPYGWAVKYRNRRFDCGLAEQHQVAAPVICVGNLTVGGTGKTPMVAYLCQWFRRQGIRVAIVSRGYRAEEGKQNDEARELGERLPDVPHIQNPDRVAAATVAIDELDMQVIVLDDGFQHRRLVRDFDFVLIDALAPFGYNRLLPRGLLREPIQSLQRAHVIALTRANLVTAEQRETVKTQVAAVAPQAKWLELAHVPTQLAAGEISESLQQLMGSRVVAFCGLGNPAGFRRTVEDCGAEIVEFLEFPDHHEFTRDDVDAIRNSIRQHRPDLVVCTHKDMVKIELDQLEGTPLRALVVEQQVLHGEAALEEILTSIVERLGEPHD